MMPDYTQPPCLGLDLQGAPCPFCGAPDGEDCRLFGGTVEPHMLLWWADYSE